MQIRIEHDDDALAIIDKFANALKEIVTIADDDEFHDGFMLVNITPIGPTPASEVSVVNRYLERLCSINRQNSG